MIEKLLIDAATKAGFQEQLEAGNIPDYAVVFISDSKEIYTKGKYYPCPYTKEELDNKFSECNSNIQDTIESLLGQANGIASLDSSGKVPSSQLPSYVDDVLEYNNRSGFPGTGESGKIYIAKDTNLTYRWSGSTYVEVSQSLALGETSSTAYAGNKGKQNADNIASLQTKTTNIDNYTVNGKKISTNPTISKGDVGLGNVNNTSDANKPISTATQNALNQKQNTLVSGTNIKTLNGQSLLGSGNLTADGPITIQNMNLMTVSQYNSIVGSLANNTYKSYLCADAAGNVKGGAVTLNTEFGKLIHSDDAMAVNLGDIMIIGKANNTGFVKILPLNDAKTKTDSFPGTYGLMVPNDKEKLDKCVTDIDQTCFRCYTGTFNTNNCLWYGYYMYCNLGRPAGSTDGETYLLRVANIGVEDGAMLIHQTAWSSLDPSKCFYRIIKTTDRNVYEPPTTTYGEWQEGTGGEEVSSEGTLPNPISILERKDYNLNNYKTNGVYMGDQINPQVQYTNTPFGTSVYQFILEVRNLGSSVIVQNYYGFNSSGENNTGEYTRYYTAGTWTPWRKVARDVTLSGTLPSGTAIGTLSVNGASTVLRVPNYTLPTASSSTKGGITLGFTENGKNYPVELDSSGKAFVNVPWTDTKVTVDSTLSSSSTNPVQNKVINSALAGKAASSHTHAASQVTGLASVATSGSYNDLSNKPTIPSAYTLPTATSSRLGGVKVGAGLSVAGDGTLSVSSGGVADSVEWDNVVGKPSSFTPSSHTHPSSQITGLTASRALISDSSGHPTVSAVTSTELGYLDGVTSNIQTQLNGKAASSHNHEISEISGLHMALNGKAEASHTHTASQVTGLTASRALVSDSSGHPAVSAVTSTELSYLDGVTSSIQTQINNKSSVAFNSSLSSGKEIGKITINGSPTTIYAPDSIATTSSNGLLRQLKSIGGDSYFLDGTGNWKQFCPNLIDVTEVDSIRASLTVSSFDMTTIQDNRIFILRLSESVTADWGLFTITDGDTDISVDTGVISAVTIGKGEYLCIKTSNDSCYLIGAIFANPSISNSWTAYQDFKSGAGNSGSDMRFKSEVENVNSTLDDINKINVIKYIWEHPDEKDVKYTFGVNADELINLGGIYATMVHHRQDKYDTKWVEYDRFGVLAIKGLQELNKKLEDKCAKYEKIISVLADKCGVNIDEL